MTRTSFAACAAIVTLALGAGSAAASPVTNIGGMSGPLTTINFSQFTGANQFNGVNGPVQIGGLVGSDVVATDQSNADNLWLYNAGWGLDSNGSWDSGRDGFLGIYPAGGPIRITFNSALVSGVGMLFNYAPGFNAEPITLKAFDSGGNLLELFDISGTAPVVTLNGLDEGAFRGIQLGGANIRYVEVYGSGAAAVLDDLVFTQNTAAVPEPVSLVLVGSGVAGLVARRYRRTRAQ